MATRQRLRELRERGDSVDDREIARLKRVAQAAEAAFSASTLLEAQEAIGAAIPGIVTSITLDSDFDSPTGSAPQTTATRTLTVPAGNPGEILAGIQTTVTPQYDLASAGYLGVADGDRFTADDGDSLTFKIALGTGYATIQLRDATTGALIGSAFTITTT